MTLEQRILSVPTVNDDPFDFDWLFHLWRQANDDHLDIEINFNACRFLRHNAVAFLGGLARLVAYRGGRVNFRWNALEDAIYTNLAQNGFIGCFGDGPSPWHGNSIPYEDFPIKNKETITNYLKTKWLGRGWVNVSQALRDAIVGQVWEIFENAFEHSASPLGVFCCGQHYPRLGELKLCVADFGVGIPSNVRLFKKRGEVSAAAALRWAFRFGTTTKPNGMGRGMGLDLLREFIRNTSV